MKTVNLVDGWLDVCCQLFKALATLLLLTMLVLNLVNLGLRTMHRQEIASLTQWTEVLFVWMCFAGFFVIHRMRRDIFVEFLVQKLGDKGRMGVRVFVDLVIAVVLAAILSQGSRIVELQAATIELVGIPKYWEAVGLFISAALILIDVLLDLVYAVSGGQRTVAVPAWEG
ncbi:MAG: TRAP transporter small permease [Janthinobacterium lividum]